MGLTKYKEKRKFNETPEPPGKIKSNFNKSDLKFVIQRHEASRLHYDFRLEMEGVLKSWAVPKGPSMNPKDKRLAMEVEDHPFDYRTFEGDIPKGNYGAGHVDIWDEGTYRSIHSDDRKEGEKILLNELKEGNVKFILNGKKIKGEFAIVKMKSNMKNAWLLIKKKDEFAVNENYTAEDYLDNKPSKKKVSAGTKKKYKVGTKPAKKKSPDDETAVIDGSEVKLTHLDKIYFPDENYTKADVINYYASVSKFILPYLKDRPESLRRHPNGIKDKGFFQKDVVNVPEFVETVKLRTEDDSKDVNYLVCNNEAALTYMNNMGCIEINPWNSRVKSLRNPDYFVIDLDPGKNTCAELAETAKAVKDVLGRAGAEGYCKTSGSTGLHVYVPLGAKYDFEMTREFAKIIAYLVNEELPDITSIERSPKARKKKIYIDYLQNSIGQTLAAPYSVRPKPGAKVSTPLKWSEITADLDPGEFTIKTVPKRLAKTGDLFEGVLGKGIDLKRSLKSLGA
jgi:bifunctional non-homologous end joining protein LigD